MNEADASSKLPPPRRLGHRELLIEEEDHYEGVDLAPKTQDSLVTWDVSVHARREQERWRSLQRLGERGDY